MGFPSVCRGNPVIEDNYSSSAIGFHQYFQLLLSVTQRCSNKLIVWLNQNSIPSRDNRRGYFGNACEPVYFLNICTCFAGDVAEDISASGFKSLFMDLSTSQYLVPLWTCGSPQQTHRFMIFCDHLISYQVYQVPLILALQASVSNSSSFTLTITFMTRQASVTPAFSPNWRDPDYLVLLPSERILHEQHSHAGKPSSLLTLIKQV